MTTVAEKKRTLRLNQRRKQQRDPTHTLVLRSRFAAEATRRFKRIKKLIWESIVINDALALNLPEGIIGGRAILVNQSLPRQAFAFKTNPEKVASFMEWLSTEVNAEIFQVAGPTRQVTGSVEWANVYIDSAYKRGLTRGNRELAKAGVKPSALPTTGDPDLVVDALFNRPFHADRVGLAYTRVFSELRGITDSMEQIISRELAQGLAEGRGPAVIARRLNNAIEKAGGTLAITDPASKPMRSIQRARIMARTEVIRAHHSAMINTYREAGLEGVRVKAEWMTAGDDRVCPDCEALEGLVFSLDVIEAMIPLHAQCRCVALPYIGKISGAGWKKVDVGIWRPPAGFDIVLGKAA